MEYLITICKSSKQKGTQYHPCYELLEPIYKTISSACSVFGGGLEKSFVSDMSACGNRCKAPCHRCRKVAYLSDELDSKTDTNYLGTNAKQYVDLSFGLHSSANFSEKPRSDNIPRPAAKTLTVETNTVKLS